MTHQNHQTNGASLEDCHTNFFALTELYGIKWRKLVWGESAGGGEGEEGGAPLADPVISSYARCLAGDILCVWRRVAAQPADIYDMTAPAPPPLSLRAAKELWIFWYGEEPDLNGLVAPELIASQGDQGSWESGLSYECRSLLFKALHNLIERCLLSRDFVRLGKWFVQPYDGDEEDVGKSPWHLSFSFAFFLHGESTVCASVDVRQHPPVRTLTAKRLARLNAQDYNGDAKVILAPFGLEGSVTGRSWSDAEPGTARLLDAWRQLYPLEQGCPALEVVCGGVRMRYPSPYVLLTEMEAPPPRPPHRAALAHRTLAHAATTTTTIPATTHQGTESSADGDKCEDFADPTRKTTCTCSKWRRRRARPPPFHRRPRRHTAGGHGGHAAHAAHPAGGHAHAGGRVNIAHAHRGHTKPTGEGGTCPGGGGGAAACSPASCGAASPAAPGSQPECAPSPHHKPQHQSAGGVPTTLHTPAPTPDPLAPPTPAPSSAPPPTKLYTQGDSPPVGGGGPAAEAAPSLSRRPTLPVAERRLDPMEDEHSLHMLYDYTTVHAWLEHPVKRFKGPECVFREEPALGWRGVDDLYAGHDHTNTPAMLDHHLHLKREKHEPQEDVKEYKNLFTSDGLCATLKDLDQIFDNSDDAASGDETVRLLQVQTPPDSNKSVECGGGGTLGRCVRAEELSKMFPTPPSLEAHAQPSPGFTLPDDATPTPHPHHHHRHQGSPPPDPIDDWSYVFKPATMYKYVGSSKYAPLTSLPSQLLPAVTLPPHAVYRPQHRDIAGQVTQHGVKRSSSPATENRNNGRRSCDTVGTPGGANPTTAGVTSVPSVRSYTSPATSPRRKPEPERPRRACPLLLNVLLADTVLNVFRDHNFDSCTLCVCNAGPKVVGNIRGADAATYLAGAWGDDDASGQDDEPGRCSCGFSAVLNRRLAHMAGLFYEDEMEITGLAEEPGGRCVGPPLADVAGVVLALCAAPSAGAASALARAAADVAAPGQDPHRLNQLEYSDGGLAARNALRAAAGGAGGAGGGACSGGVHRWPFIGARAPRSSHAVVKLMRRLRPLLQDAIQKRCCGARMWDGVTGPLTWRQFHRLAGRGNEDLCEPQPVPPLLVGHDRDWISLSPYALRHWERLALEPYSYCRDVAYIVLAADCEALTDPLKTFFRELSTVYESCRLGRHQPITRLAKDGLVRTSPSDNTRDANCEEWTGDLPPGRLGEYLKAYAETLRTSLVPQLANLNLDRNLLECEKSSHMERPSPSPMRPPSTPDHPPTPSSQSDHEDASTTPTTTTPGNSSTPGGGGSWEEEEGGSPALVIYVVEPPGAPAHRAAALLALLRLANSLTRRLHHHSPLIKIISVEGVCSAWGWGSGDGSGAGSSAGALRALAFSVFAAARRTLTHRADGKSLTGFGTAATANLFINNKDEKNRAPYRLFSPAWVLAPPRALKEVAETWGQSGSPPGVLFLSYCLSHDQRWLLAAATDARGELLDTHAINIHVPARSRRRRSTPARRLGLTKLLDWALGVMSQAAQPWRLVVGRLGRIGHGELKGWSWLLSRKNLTRSSAVLREICNACSVVYPSNAPCILSACLVSTEPDPCLRLMADTFTPDERFSQASIHSHLHTPRDVTATHILVFPTSATTQSNQMPFEPPMANGEDNDMNMFLDVDMVDEDMGEDNMTDLFIGDMFTMWAPGSPRASPRRHDDDDARDGSPARQHHVASHAHADQTAEAVGTVLQQPLALGYLVSTAPLGPMPAWWWAGCAHLRDACPAFLKTALHLHAGSLTASDDFTSLTAPQRRDNAHPLDSTTTTDVLRYVLEGYNALSWLALDGSTHDRLSCLPLHVQALMQLYHTFAALG